MKKTGKSVGFFRSKNPLIYIPDVLDGKKCVWICCLDLLSYMRHFSTVDKGEDHLDITTGSCGIDHRRTIIFRTHERNDLIVRFSGVHNTQNDFSNRKLLLNHKADIRTHGKAKRKSKEVGNVGKIIHHHFHGKKPDHNFKKSNNRGEILDAF